MTKIKFNDLKTIGYSFKVSTNKVEDSYSTYTVVDYNEDVKYDNGLSGTQILLSKNNTDKKYVIFYKHDFIKYAIDTEIELKQPLLDNEYIKVVF